MKITTNGIGIKSLSVAKTGLSVIGNTAFEEWAKGGVRLYKMTHTGPNPVYTFHLKDGPAPKPYNCGKFLCYWMRAWSNQQKRGTLQNFGATEPISVVLDLDGKKLHVTMPPVSQCAKVMRPKGNWKAKLKVETLDKQFEMALDRKAELEAEPTTIPEPDVCAHSAPRSWSPTYPEKGTTDRDYDARPRLDLLEAIDLINQHKDILGRALVFSVTAAGKLRAIVEYGG